MSAISSAKAFYGAPQTYFAFPFIPRDNGGSRGHTARKENEPDEEEEATNQRRLILSHDLGPTLH